MKKYLALLFLFSALAFAGDKLIFSPSGNLILDAKTGSTIKAFKSVEASGGISGPGSVPIGGMVAVMPTTHANAWQPPATGVIKDGFMRADGAAVPACADCVIPAGTGTPNMVGAFAKGAATSGTTAAAQKLVAAHIPQVSTGYTPSGSVSGVTGTNSTSLVSGITGSNSISLTAAGQTLGQTFRYSSASDGRVFAFSSGGSGPNGVFPASGMGASIPSDSFQTDIQHAHPASSVSGSVSWSQTGSGSAAAQSWSQTGSGTLNGNAATITVGTAVGSQSTLPDPTNTTVVWVIRVK